MKKTKSDLTKKLVKSLIKNNLKIAFAESITGGLLASEIISIPDASKVIEESFVVYSAKAKQKILDCKSTTIEKYSVYSFEVVREMLKGLRKLSGADILVSVSGIAGPSVDFDKKIGEVFFAIEYKDKVYQKKLNLSGNRNEIRKKSLDKIFTEILNLLQ